MLVCERSETIESSRSVDALAALENCDPFGTLGGSHLREIAAGARVRHTTRGHQVYMDGDACRSVFVIAEGGIKTFTTTSSGKEIALSFWRKGDFFGETAFTDCTEHDHCASTTDSTVLLEIDVESIEAMMIKRPSFGLAMVQVLGNRLNKSRARFQNLMFRGARERLAAILLELGEHFGRKPRGADGVEIDLRITHHELGSLIGLTRESVTCAMGDLELSEMIRTVKRRIFLTDLSRLSEISC